MASNATLLDASRTSVAPFGQLSNSVWLSKLDVIALALRAEELRLLGLPYLSLLSYNAILSRTRPGEALDMTALETLKHGTEAFSKGSEFLRSRFGQN
jgi:hypothetical protein